VLQAEAPDLVNNGQHNKCQKHWQGLQLRLRPHQRLRAGCV